MSISISRFPRLVTLTCSVLLLVFSSALLAQGNSGGNGKAKGKNKNVGVGNASDGIAGQIKTNKGIAYTGQPLEISLQFMRGAELVSAGEVDAFVVIFAPKPVVDDGAVDDEPTDADTSGESDPAAEAEVDATTDALADAVVLPVNSVASSDSQKLFELEQVDVSTLPAGTYQLGLILTDPGGSPLVINDWYKGLLGLIDIVGLTISDEALDFDEDMDGNVDDDSDGDGFSDDPLDESADATATPAT